MNNDQSASALSMHESVPRRSRATGVIKLLAAVSLAVLAAGLTVRFVQAAKKSAALEIERSGTHTKTLARAQQVPVVSVTRGVSALWQPLVTLEGSVGAGQEVDLGFKVSGRIEKINVALGAHVRAGQVLATLEDKEARAQVKAADAQARGASAQLALAGDAKMRVDTLVQSGAQSQASGVQFGEQQKLAAAQLDGARAQGDLARAYLDSHILRAPFPGTITRAPGGPGAVVNPMSPMAAVFHLVDARSVKLAGTIAERDLGLVKPGDAVEVRVGQRAAHGKLVAVVGATDPMTRRVPIEALLENSGTNPLLPGQFARASIKSGEPVTTLALPATALRPGSQDEIFVVAEGKLHLRHVTFVVGEGGRLLVRDGLSPAEDVAVSPTAEWKNGDAVAAGVEGSP